MNNNLSQNKNEAEMEKIMHNLTFGIIKDPQGEKKGKDKKFSAIINMKTSQRSKV